MNLSQRRVAALATAVLVTLAATFLLYQLRSVVMLLVAAIALAAMLRPLAAVVMRSGLSRSLVGLLLVLCVFLGLAAFLGVSAYALAEEAPRAVTDVQVRLADLRDELAAGPGWQRALASRLPRLESFEEIVAGIAVAPESASATETATPAEENAGEEPQDQGAAAAARPALEESAQRTGELLRVLAGATGSVAGLLTQVIVLIFLSLYWSLEFDWFERLWTSLLPPQQRSRARSVWRSLEENVGAHLRSEVVQVTAAFLLLWLGFWLAGAKYALLFAWAGALLWLILLVGWLLALLPIALLVLLSGPIVAAIAAFWQLLVFGVLEFVVEPRLDVRRRAGSILGLLVAMVMLDAFGLVGLLFAGPVAVAINSLLVSFFAVQPTDQTQPVPTQQSLEQRISQLRATLTEADAEVPLRTRDLYRRLEELVERAQRLT